MYDISYAASAWLLDHSVELTLQESVANCQSLISVPASWGHTKGNMKLMQGAAGGNVAVTQEATEGVHSQL